MKTLPKISIVIPTLNAEKALELCLRSIAIQDYPQEKIEIIIVDGGSDDGTVVLAKVYGAKVFENELKTAEAGKAVGVKKAGGEYIALVDSDNILPSETWLRDMIMPLLEEKDAVGSEPLEYTWRKQDGFITRYCALIGMNDPFVHFLGNYDRFNLLTGKWTNVKRKEVNKDNYLLITFNSIDLPTVGANGTVFRAKFLKKNLEGDYLFDIDILAKYIHKKGSAQFLKIKNGIIHTYCERDVGKFARKQRRRVRDYLFHQNEENREFDWKLTKMSPKTLTAVVIFIVYCLTLIPLFLQSLYGFIRKPDFAWFFHPFACLITLWEYSTSVVYSLFEKSEMTRKGWEQ